jgi:hypothetical protein
MIFFEDWARVSCLEMVDRDIHEIRQMIKNERVYVDKRMDEIMPAALKGRK